MELSAQQESALDSFFRWLDNKEDNGRKFFSIQGPAGCGKTTIASAIRQRTDRRVYPMAYSGKAASVLRSKGLMNATTIHSKVYLPANEADEEADELQAKIDSGELKDAKLRSALRRLEELRSPRFALRPGNPFVPKNLDRDYGDYIDDRGFYNNDPHNTALIILDECSMANAEIGNDLLSFNVPVLAFGDPYQLPPIEGAGFFDKNPDIILTEVHRQALESPVLRLATLAREGKSLPPGKHGDSIITVRTKIGPDHVTGVDQILSGSNKVRIQLNQEYRQLKGYTGELPLAGEKVICLRNNKNDFVLNGEIFELSENAELDEDGKTLWLNIGSSDMAIKCHPECFNGKIDLIKTWNYGRRSIKNEFDFAWAITAHKAQGSEWKSVLCWADMFRWASARDDFKRWLYTTITRASERVIVAL